MTNDTKPQTEIDCEFEAESATARCKFTGLSGGAIAGIVIGTIACLAIIAVIIFFIKRRWENGEESEEERRITNLARHVCCCSCVHIAHGHAQMDEIPRTPSRQSIQPPVQSEISAPSTSDVRPQAAVLAVQVSQSTSTSVLPVAYDNQVMAGEGEYQRDIFMEKRRFQDGRVKITGKEDVQFWGKHDGDEVETIFQRERVRVDRNLDVDSVARPAISLGDD